MKKATILITSLILLVLSGYSQTPYTIIHFDSTIWSVTDVHKLNESEFIIVGNSKYIEGQYHKIFIAKINTEGDILWKKEHAGWMQWYSSICAKSDGNYYITMEGPVHDALLLETNHIGDSVWSFTSTEPEANNKCFGSIKEFPDGRFVLSEAIYVTSIVSYVIKSNYYILTSNGTIISKFEAGDEQVFDIEIISENEFIAAESSWNHGIVKYNIEGQILNVDSCVEFPEFESRMWEIYNISENQFYATGLNSNYPEKFGLLSNINGNGQVEYCAIDTSLNYFLGIIPTNDNQLIYYGMKGEDTMIVGEMTSSNFIPKIEINNYFTPEVTSDILISNNTIYIFAEIFNGPSRAGIIKIPVDSIVSSISELNYTSINTYPNPAKDYMVFKVQKSGFRNLQIFITNSYGQHVALLPVRNEVTVWDTRNIKPGVYFYLLKSNESALTGKLIIAK